LKKITRRAASAKNFYSLVLLAHPRLSIQNPTATRQQPVTSQNPATVKSFFGSFFSKKEPLSSLRDPSICLQIEG